jgi:hypothetical protein
VVLQECKLYVVVYEIAVIDGLRSSKSEIPEDRISGCQNALE